MSIKVTPLATDFARGGEWLLLAGWRPGRAPTGECLHLGLLRDLEGIAGLDSEVSHRALEFCMTKQQLHYTQILGSAIYQRRFGSPHRMGPVRTRIKANLSNPTLNDPGILPGGQMR
jgi:hypothetical protein